MRIARRASLAYFHPRRFAGRYRRNRRHSAAPDDPVLMFSRDRRISSRPVICRRNSSAFSKRPSFIFLFMEIIQLVAINVHDKAQHIVDQSRKPCAFIPQQVEDFRHFALGLRTDINRRAVTAIYRSEEGAFEIRQYDLFRRNPAGSFTVVVWVSTFVFSAVGADVFPSGASVFSSSGSGILRTTFESKGACPAII